MAGKTDVVKLFVEGWPEAVREKNRFGDTPLHLAAGRQKRKVVRFLVERWPEGRWALGKGGKTPLLRFEEESRSELRVSGRHKEEIIALLVGPYRCQ
jgi:hypothetical protein